MTDETRSDVSAPTGYGFDAQMAEARFDRFPAWYGARCLLDSNPYAERTVDEAQASVPRAA